MNNQINNGNTGIEIIASGKIPVVKREIKTQTVYPAEAYDDYGISAVYPFSFNFGFLLIIIGVILIIVQVLLFFGLIVFAIIPKTVKCKVCGGENHAQNGKFPENCAFCGSKL